MRGSRPLQAALSKDTDLSKTSDTRRVIESMVDGLNDHKISGMSDFFSETFRWMGNAGCGTKNGLDEFQRNWQKPFQAAFSDKVCIDEARLFNFDPQHVHQQLVDVLADDALIQLSYPFETMHGADAFYGKAYQPLHRAIPDLERRETIVIGGRPENNSQWVGCAGYYTGTSTKPWLDIPATGHQVSLRFHEFYRFCENKVVEVQALWDIPEVMMQACAWPMSPSLGREWHVPSGVIFSVRATMWPLPRGPVCL